MRNIKTRLERLEAKVNDKPDGMQFPTPLETLQSINEALKEHYPDHHWNRLSLSERQRIWLKIPDGYSEYEWYQIPMQKRAFILMDTPDSEIQLQIEVRTLYITVLAKLLNEAKEKEKNK